MAGVVLGVEALSTRIHTVALVEQQGPQAHAALATRGAPTGSTGAVAYWETGYSLVLGPEPCHASLGLHN